jgi:hypothetical protein
MLIYAALFNQVSYQAHWVSSDSTGDVTSADSSGTTGQVQDRLSIASNDMGAGMHSFNQVLDDFQAIEVAGMV